MSRVLFVGNQVHDLFIKNRSRDLVFGGAEVQMYFWSKKLSSSKHRVTVLTSGHSKQGLSTVQQVRVLNYKNRSFKTSSIVTFFLFLNALILERPDHIFSRLKDRNLIPVYLYSVIFNKKTYFMVAHDNAIKSPSGLLDRFYYYFIGRCDHVFVQNSYQLGKYNSYFKKTNVSLLKNSFPMSPDGNNLASREYILWVGRGERWKGIEELCAVIERMESERFLVVLTKAKDGGYYFRSLEKLSSYKNVKILDYVDFKYSQELYNNAKVFINTSQAEGFPNSFLQAGISKTPIVSLNVNPSNFVVENGIFCNGDKELLIKSIRNLVNNKDLWEEKSARLSEYVLKNHDVDKNVEQIKKHLEAL